MVSKRLTSAVKYVKGFNYLADCGTDHDLFPIFAVENNYVKKAIASDNKKGPLQNCIKNVESRNLQDRIIPKLAHGLQYLNEEIDVVSILGMGGILMTEILSEADLKHVKRLVLSPNSDAKILRKWLMENYYRIVHEEMLEERNKYYQIIVCEPGIMRLSESELEFGPLLLKSKDKVLIEYINKLLEQLNEAKYNVMNMESHRELKNRIKVLEEIVNE